MLLAIRSSFIIDFNSIKVRLKRMTIMLLRLQVMHFNSIKVRLKPNGDTHQFKVMKFQFHKGTIKTFRCWLLVRFCYISIP